ncbi:formin-binding protein HOF1 SCDLUD_004155 [Saccharomycodes ludwigii]|uniref:formin-binding protein HOF1 n=1 Tax=Saccharomycodes ludwigii TaxID=36035 RepID=UPI001E85675E|nr:hypothetical protein SCDLUD_004155 [Saccharomycodes ludwigii]KAH3899856.1 hypothetical protein SCDLUD_004155 [Saccharomycodes ludwigii]
MTIYNYQECFWDERDQGVVTLLQHVKQGTYVTSHIYKYFEELGKLQREYSRRLNAINEKYRDNLLNIAPDYGQLNRIITIFINLQEKIIKSHGKLTVQIETEVLQDLHDDCITTLNVNYSNLEGKLRNLQKNKAVKRKNMKEIKGKLNKAVMELRDCELNLDNQLGCKQNFQIDKERNKWNKVIDNLNRKLDICREEYQASKKHWINEWWSCSMELQNLELNRIETVINKFYQYSTFVLDCNVVEQTCFEKLTQSLMSLSPMEDISSFSKHYGTGRINKHPKDTNNNTSNIATSSNFNGIGRLNSRISMLENQPLPELPIPTQNHIANNNNIRISHRDNLKNLSNKLNTYSRSISNSSKESSPPRDKNNINNVDNEIHYVGRSEINNKAAFQLSFPKINNNNSDDYEIDDILEDQFYPSPSKTTDTLPNKIGLSSPTTIDSGYISKTIEEKDYSSRNKENTFSSSEEDEVEEDGAEEDEAEKGKEGAKYSNVKRGVNSKTFQQPTNNLIPENKSIINNFVKQATYKDDKENSLNSILQTGEDNHNYSVNNNTTDNNDDNYTSTINILKSIPDFGKSSWNSKKLQKNATNYNIGNKGKVIGGNIFAKSPIRTDGIGFNTPKIITGQIETEKETQREVNNYAEKDFEVYTKNKRESNKLTLDRGIKIDANIEDKDSQYRTTSTDTIKIDNKYKQSNSIPFDEQYNNTAHQDKLEEQGEEEKVEEDDNEEEEGDGGVVVRERKYNHECYSHDTDVNYKTNNILRRNDIREYKSSPIANKELYKISQPVKDPPPSKNKKHNGNYESHISGNIKQNSIECNVDEETDPLKAAVNRMRLEKQFKKKTFMNEQEDIENGRISSFTGAKLVPFPNRKR